MYSKGECIFITAKLPGFIKMGSDNLIEKYLFLITLHNGFESITQPLHIQELFATVP
jgi:hypothetical protein